MIFFVPAADDTEPAAVAVAQSGEEWTIDLGKNVKRSFDAVEIVTDRRLLKQFGRCLMELGRTHLRYELMPELLEAPPVITQIAAGPLAQVLQKRFVGVTQAKSAMIFRRRVAEFDGE